VAGRYPFIIYFKYPERIMKALKEEIFIKSISFLLK